MMILLKILGSEYKRNYIDPQTFKYYRKTKQTNTAIPVQHIVIISPRDHSSLSPKVENVRKKGGLLT